VKTLLGFLPRKMDDKYLVPVIQAAMLVGDKGFVNMDYKLHFTSHHMAHVGPVAITGYDCSKQLQGTLPGGKISIKPMLVLDDIDRLKCRNFLLCLRQATYNDLILVILTTANRGTASKVSRLNGIDKLFAFPGLLCHIYKIGVDPKWTGLDWTKDDVQKALRLKFVITPNKLIADAVLLLANKTVRSCFEHMPKQVLCS
jgi:hypothetical protein